MPDPTGRVSHLPQFHRGESWKQPCRVATTATITIATDLNAGDTIDGVVLAALDRVLVKDQSTGSQNGIYYAGVTPARDYDMDQDGATTVTASEVMGALVYIIAGTANAGKLYRNTNTTAPTLGTTALTFAEIVEPGWTTISPAQLTANTDNYNPTGLSTADIIRVSTDASRNLTGITAPSAVNRHVILANIGSFNLVLKHDVTSTAANRFYAPNSTDMTLQQNSAALLAYDLTSSRWRIIGGTGTGGGTITVTEPDGTSIATVDTLRFPNGTLTDLGGGDVDVRQVPTGFIGARAYNTAAVSVASGGSGTIITLDSERYDSDAYHSTSANTGRMTVPAGMGGKHHLIGNIRFASSALGERRLELLLNGTTVIAAQSEQGVIAAAVSVMVATVYDLAATDYVEMRAFQDSGGALNVEAAGNFTPEFSATKLDSGKVGSGVGASAWNNAAQSVADSTDTALTLDSEYFDTDGFHSTASNTSRMTVPAGMGGKYVVTGAAHFIGGAAGTVGRALRLRVNGTAYRGGDTRLVPTAATSTGLATSAVLDLVAGDYVDLMGFQNSGGAINVGQAASGSDASVCTTLSIMRVDAPGVGQAWQAYTPTLGNVTLGNGTLVGRYKQVDGDTYLWRMDFVFGSTSSIAADITAALPATAKTGSQQTCHGAIFDTSAAAYFAASGRIASGATTVGIVIAADGTGDRIVDATNPMTWATGDTLTLAGTLEV